MKKMMLLTVAVFVLIVMQLNFALAIEVFQTQTELKQYNPDKAYKGYTLFRPNTQRGFDGALIFLIDMEGNIVRTWKNVQNPKLYEDGHIVGGFTELDWDGNIVWEWRPPADRSNIRPHHDMWRIFNKKLNAYTYLGVIRYTPTQEEIVMAGCDPSKEYTTAFTDGVVEVDKDGNIIWEWNFLEHGVQNVNPEWPNCVAKGKTIADYPGKIDLNWLTDGSRRRGGPAGLTSAWQHVNALDYNEELDHIAVNAKNWSEFYVIDHGATFIPNDPKGSRELAASDKGDFLYRFGNPSAYQQGDPPMFLSEGHQQMYGAHNIQWIKKGLPGAGNFLIFDNGCWNPKGFHSVILEINPYLDADKKNTGNYVNPPDAGYVRRTNNSNQIVWSYQSTKQSSFYSNFISGCQRLPNGNTLINSGATGHIFEVTAEGEIVWEYINPVAGMIGTVSTVQKDSDDTNFRVFRAHRYGLDYPGLAGRDLTPKGK
ncbi:MAG: aryl-sulfate sulfotransferase, partial [Deltaproteobacteria bacterium]|nr:aryl-sulfate sulfotransferase [Deltaproteobacteria bacterium]